MQPDDPRHGFTRGYHAGCRERCCLDAMARYEKAGRLARLNGGRIEPALGAQRRIQALMRLGWTCEDIAREAGFAHRNHIHRVLRGQKGKPCRYILRDTHRAICEAYERMAMRLPESNGYRTRAQKMAERNDWAPPLAWDDIDDPNEIPRGVRSRQSVVDDSDDETTVEMILAGEWRTPCSPQVKVEVVRRWLAQGGSLKQLGRKTGWNTNRYRPGRAA